MGDLSKVNGFYPDQIDFARTVAEEWYEPNGWQAYPSRHDDKRPLLPKFAHWWEGGAPSVRELWQEYPSGNVQVVCGLKYDLCVLDLDGAKGKDAFIKMCEERGTTIPRTWTVSSDRANGMHLWFRIPPKWRKGPSIGRRLLWGVWDELGGNKGTGGWEKRAAVELLCDRCLVMAPPSVHPKNRKRKYMFHSGCSPKDMPKPAFIPEWILDIQPVEAPRKPIPVPRYRVEGGRISVAGLIDGMGRLELPAKPNDVRDAIHDKVALAASWGLRFASDRPNASGWMECHDIDRDDDNPSAMFNPATGRFWRPLVNDGRSVCLFRLAVELGIYAGWREAVVDLDRLYGPVSPGREVRHGFIGVR